MKDKYSDYSLGLALFDAVPVLIFLMSGIVIYAISGSTLVIAGSVLAFAGGMCKVIWKLRVVCSGVDSKGLTKAFHILLPLGLCLMVAAAVVAVIKGQGSALWRAVTSMPAVLFFIAGFAGACLMGWLGSRLDNSARSNWIEEIINTAWQSAILIGVLILYFTLCYHAGDAAKTALRGSADVKVTETEDAYFFDGKGSDDALIFYPGARVEAAAYAPLMEMVAGSGTDCFLCKMPGNLAILGKDMASDIREDQGAYGAGKQDNYSRWYIGGHSLGGAVAAMLAEEEAWDGLIMLAAYPSGPVDEDALSIYGSEDRVLNMEKYKDAKSKGLLLHDVSELVIAGGNHAGFGDYGEQKGDGPASITAAEQQQMTAEAILRFVGDN